MFYIPLYSYFILLHKIYRQLLKKITSRKKPLAGDRPLLPCNETLGIWTAKGYKLICIGDKFLILVSIWGFSQGLFKVDEYLMVSLKFHPGFPVATLTKIFAVCRKMFSFRSTQTSDLHA